MTDAAADPLDPTPPETDHDSGRDDALATPPGSTAAEVDLDAIEHDLTGVEAALTRLADGTYWTDEVTGEPIPEHVLVRNPIARRA